VDIQPLPELLEELLHDASDDGLEVCLASSGELPEAQLDAVASEYVLRFERALGTVVAQRGEPSFRGAADSPDFPVWADAAELGLWSEPAGLIYVALRERGAGMQLVAGARPHPIGRDTITLLPPSD
jgi:hypothetical protein